MKKMKKLQKLFEENKNNHNENKEKKYRQTIILNSFSVKSLPDSKNVNN